MFEANCSSDDRFDVVFGEDGKVGGGVEVA